MSHIGEVHPDDCLKQQNFTLDPLYLDSDTFSPRIFLHSMYHHQNYLFLCLFVCVLPSAPLDCTLHEGRDFF